MRKKCLSIVGVILGSFVSGAGAADWSINEDYKQLDVRPATDFEIFFGGDATGQITGGGFSPLTNPFPNPTRTQSYDAATNVTTVRYAGTNAGDTVPRDPNAFRHVGLFGNGPKPRVFFKSWSFATQPARVPVPKSNFAFLFDPSVGQLTITVENTSPDTVTFSDIGWLVSPTERPIEDLSRSVLPPTAFDPLSMLNDEYLPGESQSVVLSGVSLSDFIVTYGTVQFSGSSSGNDYNDIGGEWAQIRVAANLIPEPSGIVLVGSGLLLMMTMRRRARFEGENARSTPKPRRSKRRHVLLRTGTGCAAVMATVATTAPRTLAADVYAIPLKPTNADTRPRINLTANVGGNPQNVHALIDTGAQVGLYVKNHASARLGMNAGGAAGNAQGVGGNVATRTGVNVPAGLMLGAPAATPPGQASTSPAFPGTATVGQGAPGTDAILGSDWLADFNYGRTRGANGEFFWTASVAKGAQGETDARNIARLLASATPYTAQANGRPVEELVAPIFPFQNPQLPPNTDPLDSGFSLGVGLTNPGSGASENANFIIKSGVDLTMISQSVAATLGLVPSGPSVLTEINFDEFSVSVVDLELQLFDGASAVSFLMPVGVIPDAINPLNVSLLGSDVLRQFFYWEIDVTSPQSGGFFRAAIPEPGSLMLMLLLAPLACRRTISR